MPCYQCVHCGKCPVGGLKALITCTACGSPLGPGVSECPSCGQPLKGHMQARAANAGFSVSDTTQFIAHLGKKNTL